MAMPAALRLQLLPTSARGSGSVRPEVGQPYAEAGGLGAQERQAQSDDGAHIPVDRVDELSTECVDGECTGHLNGLA